MERSNGAKTDAGRRYRAYPTPEQAGRLTEWGHSCRAVWNLALEQRQYLYRHRGVTLRASAQCVQLTRARGDLPWLADLPAQSAQQVLRQLDRAYGNWWNSVAWFPVNAGHAGKSGGSPADVWRSWRR